MLFSSSTIKNKRDINGDSFIVCFQVMESEEFYESFSKLTEDLREFLHWLSQASIGLCFALFRVMSKSAARGKNPLENQCFTVGTMFSLVWV